MSLHQGRAQSVAVLWRLVRRLQHIAGFATTYGSEADPRTLLFARRWHVRRVERVAAVVASRSGADLDRVRLLARLHDVNRWPFAHNTERENFDQVDNIRPFYAQIPELGITEQDLEDLEGIHRRCATSISADAVAVLAADVLVGPVEDLMFLTCTLGVTPAVLPDALAGMVGFDHKAEPLRSRQSSLALHFSAAKSAGAVAALHRQLNEIFYQQVAVFTGSALPDAATGTVERAVETCEKLRQLVLHPIVFPINNELVCHGAWLRQRVLPWYFEREQSNDLVHLTEDEFVSRLLNLPGCPFHAEQFVPDLDVVRREHPAISAFGSSG